MRMRRASLLWLVDGVLAVCVAAAVAIAISTRAGNREHYVVALLLLAAAAATRAALQTTAFSQGHRDAARAKRAWRSPAFSAVLRAAAGSRRMLGEQVADAIDRIEDIDGYHARFIPLRFAAMATPLLIAASAALASWIAAAILLATLIPFALGMALAGSVASRAAARQLDVLARLSGLFIDRIRALPLILGFDAQDRVTRQLDGATQEVARRTVAVLRIAFLSGAIIEFFAALSVAMVAVYCGFNLLGLLPFPVPETLDLSRALFVLILAPEFYLPMRRLAAAYHDKQVGEAALERLAALTPAPVVATSPVHMLAAPPAIRFESVVIDYGERRVGPISMHIAAGYVTALSGTTGTGKSSLLHALLGLAPVVAGDILLDGRPLSPEALRGEVSWAGQATALVPGSLADNIRLARPHASDAEVEDVARRAGLTEVVQTRGAGLATLIDPRGSGLSGGERRRVGIARALLRDAPLWLLDEPTADLDEGSAMELARHIVEAGRGRTVLLVTHSAAIAALADHRVVLS